LVWVREQIRKLTRRVAQAAVLPVHQPHPSIRSGNDVREPRIRPTEAHRRHFRDDRQAVSQSTLQRLPTHPGGVAVRALAALLSRGYPAIPHRTLQILVHHHRPDGRIKEQRLRRNIHGLHESERAVLIQRSIELHVAQVLLGDQVAAVSPNIVQMAGLVRHCLSFLNSQ
jgi:hypothetical protein